MVAVLKPILAGPPPRLWLAWVALGCLTGGIGCRPAERVTGDEQRSAETVVAFADLDLNSLEPDTTWRPSSGSAEGGRANRNPGPGGSTRPPGIRSPNPTGPFSSPGATTEDTRSEADDTSAAAPPEEVAADSSSVWPAQVDLPPRSGGEATQGGAGPDSANAAGELMSMEGFDLAGLEMALVDCGADLPAGLSWELRPISQDDPSDRERRSEVWLSGQRIDQPADGEQEAVDWDELMARPVAELRAAERLSFHWLTSLDENVLEQLRNSVLVLNDGATEHRLQWRTTQIGPRTTLNFEESFAYFLLPSGAPPKRESLEVAWLGQDQLDRGIDFSLQPASGIGTWEQELKIDVSAWQGLYFEMGLLERDDQPQVRFASWYERDRSRQPFSIDKVNNAIKQAQVSLQSSGQKLAQAQLAIKKIPDEIQRLNRTSIPNGPRKGELLFERQKRIESLTRDLRNAGSTAQRLTVSIPKTQELLQALTELGKVGEQLHDKARFRFRVQVRAADGQAYPLAEWTQAAKN